MIRNIGISLLCSVGSRCITEMNGIMITIPNNQQDLSLFFDTDHKRYLKVEELLVNAVIHIMDALKLNNLYVKELCHYSILNELIIENEKVDITELKDFYNERFQECLLRYNDYYSKQMIDLFYNVRNTMCLSKEQVSDILKLKFRNNICYFKLCSESSLVIDFAEQGLFVQSDAVNIQVISKIKNSGLRAIELDGKDGDGLYV